VEWAFNERDGGLWLDNVSLREATVVEPDAKTFRLEYNLDARPRTVPLNEPWVDLDGQPCPSSLTLAPRASAVLLRKDAVAERK
jgi:hypothetical protein